MNEFTLTDEIRRIVRAETMFLRHYWGEVLANVDPRGKGRVKVAVPALGWNSQAEAPWCVARQVHALVIPEVGESVEVYFVEGDRSRPAWLGQAHEISGQTPSSYGATTQVVYQDPKSGAAITWDRLTRTLEVNLGTGLFLTLKSGDAVAWAPNILTVDPVTGVPHGGVTAGILKLKGG